MYKNQSMKSIDRDSTPLGAFWFLAYANIRPRALGLMIA